MRASTIEPLSDETERLLAAERGIPPESEALRLRALARARTALRDAAATPPLGFWRRRMPQLVAIGATTAFAVAAYATWQRSRPQGDESPVGAPSATVLSEPHATTHTAPPVPPATGVPIPAASNRGPEVVPKAEATAAPRPASSSDAYGAELALLQKARAAVADGNHTAALGAIAEHQRRFPTGRLREEREALRVTALSGLGRTAEARRAAERFRAQFPRSVLLPRIEQAIRQAP